MPDYKLFVAPNTCARVPTIALEEIGVPFETELVRTASLQQKSPEYLVLNPRGKVPMLLVDGTPLTENVAILSWLNETYPEAQLMPKAASAFERYVLIGDLSFFSATVHPAVTRIAMPVKFIDDKNLAFDRVRPSGVKAMNDIMKMIETRLENGPWWYGDTWSAVDGYLYWVWSRITGVGYPDADFPNLRRHMALSNERPAVQRAMAREAVNVDILKSEGLYLEPR